MISFDFTRSAPPEIVRRALEYRIPQKYHALLMTIATAVFALAGVWSIESHRLRDTLAVQAMYLQRYNDSERALKRANVYEQRVKRLVALDRRLRFIRASGYSDAQRLAEIANNVPPRAWVTSIAYDGDALTLEGRAEDLRSVGDVVRGLTHAAHLSNLSLISAVVSTDPPEKGLVKYVLRAESIDN